MTDLAVRELPLFPLPDVVLFPQEVLPLHIFEPRYRMMLRTVMAEDRRFGVIRWDPQQQRMAEIGCCAEILHCQTQEDDRSNIVTMGQQRFRILDIVREAPFRVAMVSWIEDTVSDEHSALETLAEEVTAALRDVVELTGKLIGKRTWGGLVGRAAGVPLMDGGFVGAPSSAVWDPATSQWIAENVGVAPDIEVELDPALVRQGKDPQLERAVAEVMKKLQAPVALPKKPAPPVKVERR